MVRRFSQRAALAAIALFASTALAGTVAAQAIVVRATGPSAAKFPRGMKLGEGTQVKLEAGDTLTVLDRVGSRVLKGRGAFKIDSKVLRDRALFGSLSRSLDNRSMIRAGADRFSQGRTLRAGAVRGGGPLKAVQSGTHTLWIADIDRGGKLCLPKGSNFYLVRKDNANLQRSIRVSEAGGGKIILLFFPIGTYGIPWPVDDFPLTDNNLLGRVAAISYRIDDEGATDRAVEFEVVSLAPDAIPDNAADLGSLLLANGCAVQFDLLADSLAGTDTPAG